MTVAWRESDVRLAYRVGDLSLFSLRFNAFVCNEHFADAKPDGLLSPPPELYQSGAQVFLGRSQPVTRPLPIISRENGWLRYVPRQYRRYYVELSGSFEHYLGRFSSKTRSTLKRKVRKLVEAGGGKTDVREYRTPEELALFFPIALELSGKTYQDRLLDCGLPKDDGFRRNALATAAEGGVRAYVLFLGGSPAAYIFSPLRRGILSYDYVGFRNTADFDFVIDNFKLELFGSNAPAEGDADFDGDGDVDGADFLTWQRGVGTNVGATQPQGDANNDDAINNADLDIWKGDFGAAEAAAGAVPEPGSMVLALAAVGGVLTITRRRR